MCASYWTVDTKMTCPGCGKTTTWDLQTHFMGYLGSCEHYYKLGEKVHELEGVTVLLDGRIDDFNGDCEKCGRFFNIGAEIVRGRVKRVWVLKEYMRAAELIKANS